MPCLLLQGKSSLEAVQLVADLVKMAHPDHRFTVSCLPFHCSILQGTSSLEAVQLVADLVKTRRCSVPPVVVSCLLVLRFEQVTPVSAGGEGAGGGKAKKVRRR